MLDRPSGGGSTRLSQSLAPWAYANDSRTLGYKLALVKHRHYCAGRPVGIERHEVELFMNHLVVGTQALHVGLKHRHGPQDELSLLQFPRGHLLLPSHVHAILADRGEDRARDPILELGRHRVRSLSPHDELVEAAFGDEGDGSQSPLT